MLTYFKENKDLEHIIKTNLNLDNINISKISTGWTNIVLDIKTDTDSYIAKFPRDDFWAKCIEKDVIFSNFIRDNIGINTTNMKI